MQSRRKFIKHLSALSLITVPFSLDFLANENQYQRGGERLILKKPVPMVPPVPAILLTVNGMDDTYPEISVVWTFVVNSNPPQIGISVGDKHVAGPMIKKHREFVLNVPTAGMTKPFDAIDMSSSKIYDKFKKTGLTQGKATKVNAPTIEESPIHVECKVTHEFRIEPMRTMFIANVLATTVHPNVCDKQGSLIVENVDFFGMTPGSGEFYTMGKKVGYIGETVGRDDIKY